MRQITGAAAAAAAACVLAAVALANIPAAGHSAPPVAKKTTRPSAGPPPVVAAPSYVSVDVQTGTAAVRRTRTGAKLTTVRPPHGTRFVAVGGAEDDRTFVLAAQRGSGAAQLYLLDLLSNGRLRGPLVKLAGPKLPGRLGGCPAQLAGLAVSRGSGGMVAASMLSNCANGTAGRSEILTASFGSAQNSATFHPGRGYPTWLSWTSARSLVFDWTGDTSGIFVIHDATRPGGKAQLLIGSSVTVGGFSNADEPMVVANGSGVIATVSSSSGRSAIAALGLKGKAATLLTPPVRLPAQFCGPLWSDYPGRRLLVGCGDSREYEIQDGKVTKLPRPWQLPSYNEPIAPLIAW